MTELALSDDDIRSAISPIAEIIEEARDGRMFVLVDAEDRENEGDLIIPAQFATPGQVNFMAKHGRGLICLALSEERTRILGLEPMSRHNQTRMQTAFTVSIEAREGVSTGISAADRARTIAVAIDGAKGAQDIVSPGHVFPLRARDGGVLVRAGHTEASVDISRQAGLNPSAVICEIMNEDGTMARLPDLIAFAQLHGLKIGTIDDLIAYRRAHDRYIDRVHEGPFEPRPGFDMIAFRNRIDGVEHIALVKGEIASSTPTLTRVHRVDFATDLMGSWTTRSSLIGRTLDKIEAEGSGVLVMLRDFVPNAITRLLNTSTHELDEEERRLIGVGSQILHDLGVGRMIVLSNAPHKLIGLEGYGLSIDEWRSFDR